MIGRKIFPEFGFSKTRMIFIVNHYMKKEKKQVVYSIVNKINGKKYVGSAIDFRVRQIRHLSELRRNRHHSDYLQKSFNRYGEDNFEFQILEIVNDVEKLIETEQKWINELKPELNMTLIAGLNSHIGMKRSEITKKRISESLTGKKLSETHKKNISNSKKGVSIDGTNMNKDKIGKKLSETHKDKIRKGNSGKSLTKEVKEKISRSLKNKKLISAVSILVKKYNIEGVLIETYSSMRKAELDNGYSRDALRYHLVTKNKKMYNGFIWEIIKTNFYN